MRFKSSDYLRNIYSQIKSQFKSWVMGRPVSIQETD